MPGFERHVFVCTNTRPESHPRGCCQAKDSEAIRAALKEAMKKRGLNKRIRINAAGCLDQCEKGPTIVVYPEGVWYQCVRVDDVPEIVESHLIEGIPVERLLMNRD